MHVSYSTHVFSFVQVNIINRFRIADPNPAGGPVLVFSDLVM